MRDRMEVLPQPDWPMRRTLRFILREKSMCWVEDGGVKA